MEYSVRKTGRKVLGERPQPALGTICVGIGDESIRLSLMRDGRGVYQRSGASIVRISGAKTFECVRVLDVGNIDEVDFLGPVL